jgi:hypothetical protein
LLLVWLGGIILAIAYWPRYPRVALLVVIALALLCLSSIVGGTVGTLLPRVMLSRGTARGLSAAFFLLGITRGIIDAVAQGLLVAAIFVGRGRLDAPRDERRS